MRRIHFDFHNLPNIDTILPDFDFNSFAITIKNAVNCDSVNWFLQDNMGFCYYDTKIGTKHPGLKYDVFKRAIDAFHKQNIKVIGYINIALNYRLATGKADWVRIDKKGNRVCLEPTNPFCTTMCLNTEYADFLLELVREALVFYPETDGLFADNLLVKPCYCSKCISDMKNQNIDITDESQVTDFARTIALRFADELKKVCGDKSLDIKGLDREEDTNKYSDTLYFVPEKNSYESIKNVANGFKNNSKLCFLDGRFVAGWEDFGGFRNPQEMKDDMAVCDKLNIDFCLGDHLHPNLSNIYQESYYREFFEENNYNALEDIVGVFCDSLSKLEEIELLLSKSNINYSIIDEIDNINHYSKIISTVNLNCKDANIYYFGTNVPDSIRYNDGGVSYYELGSQILSIYHPKFLFRDGYIKHIKPYNQIKNLCGIPYYLCPPQNHDDLYLCKKVKNITYFGFDIFDSYAKTKYYKYIELLRYVLEKN